jgi:hypothetical protein
MNIVYALRKSGAKVRVTHYRVVDTGAFDSRKKTLPMHEIRRLGWQPYILAHGGKTEVTLDLGGQTISSISECSKKDAYIRKYGLEVAMERALSHISPILRSGGDVIKEFSVMSKILSPTNESASF